MKEKKNRERREEARGAAAPRAGRVFIALVFVAYAAMTLWVGLNHEPWRDEADPWLLMRDGGVGTMLSRVGYAGTPALWYLLLAPLPKLGLPYVSMTLLHLAIAWAAMLVFLIAAPFPRTLKVLFAFSYYVSYEYAVVARPYALTVLLLFAPMAAWRDRNARPLRLAFFVALLAHTTTHGLFFAALIGLVFLVDAIRTSAWRGRAQLAAIGLMLAAGSLSAWMLRAPEDAHRVRVFTPEGVRWALANAFFPDVPGIWALVLSIVILLVVSVAIGRRPGPQLFFWGSLILLGIVYTFVWVAGLRHSGLLLILTMASLWMSRSEGEISSGAWRTAALGALGVALAYSTLLATQYWQRDLREPFTGAKEMADFIRSNDLQKYEIAAHLPTPSEALLPYLGTRFYYPGLSDHGSYMLWNRRYYLAHQVSYGEAVSNAAQRFPGEPWLLLVNEEMRSPERSGFRLLYANRILPFEHRDERYWLYAPLDWRGSPLPEQP